MAGLLVMPMVAVLLARARAPAVVDSGSLVELELYLLAGWFPQVVLVLSVEVMAPRVEVSRLLAGMELSPVGAAGLWVGIFRLSGLEALPVAAVFSAFP